MELFYKIMFFILGSIMGSFYHVIATRLSNEESLIESIVSSGIKYGASKTDSIIILPIFLNQSAS